MLRILIINVVLLFSMSLHADITNIFSKKAEEKKEETTSSSSETETSSHKDTRAGSVFGRSPGKVTSSSSSSSSSSSESDRAESPTVFGKTSSNGSASSSSGNSSRASSVFGYHRGSSGRRADAQANNTDVDNKDNKEEHSKEKISDDDNPRSAPNYMWPVDGGKIVSFYGWRSSKRFHDGIDISAESGTKVFAAKSGEVIYSSNKIRGYGNMVVVRHNGGFSTVYAHNKTNLVNKGDVVQQGDVIAYVGSTGHSSGPHSHFEVRKGKYSADPLKYLSSNDVKKHSGAYKNSADNPF